MEKVKESEGKEWLRVTITDTQNRIIRKIFESVVNEVSTHPSSYSSMCGSKCMFSNCSADLAEQVSKYSHCQLNYKKKINSKSGETVPDISPEEINCFDHGVSFCPNLNIALGMQLPSSYFESRGAPSLCEDELSLILSTVALKNRNEKVKNVKCSGSGND